jgi:hypothetical protein
MLNVERKDFISDKIRLWEISLTSYALKNSSYSFIIKQGALITKAKQEKKNQIISEGIKTEETKFNENIKRRFCFCLFRS